MVEEVTTVRGGRAVPQVEHEGHVYDELVTAAAADLTEGTHYDYRAQRWRDGHDHAHVASAAPDAPPLFCGADIDTCSPTASAGSA